ncbi:hypothetical protein M3Y97_01063200 [Aphelenchoides bicaudatus]|nr:hypothetical protein M3Y97_01063200 [Aphelenchoides bicaudatus]
MKVLIISSFLFTFLLVPFIVKADSIYCYTCGTPTTSKCPETQFGKCKNPDSYCATVSYDSGDLMLGCLSKDNGKYSLGCGYDNEKKATICLCDTSLCNAPPVHKSTTPKTTTPNNSGSNKLTSFTLICLFLNISLRFLK